MKAKTKALQLVSTGLVVLFAATALIAVSSAVVQAQSSRKAEVQERIQQKREEVKERQELRKEAQGEKQEERRVAACERNNTKLTRSMDRLTGQAERHLSVISSFQTKVEEFYDSGQLTVENYDELHDAVVVAQEEAMTNVEALSEVDVDIDCSDSEIATTVGLYRTIADGTRDSLKDYRRSLVNLISAMRSEAAEDSGEDAEESEEEESSEDESEESDETEEVEDEETESTETTESEES